MDHEYRRGNIYFADLGETIGSEQSGVRPVVVLSNNIGNEHSETLVVAPMTTKFKPLPTHVWVQGSVDLPEPSTVLLEQIRTIDKTRILSFNGQVTKTEMRKIEQALRISLALE